MVEFNALRLSGFKSFVEPTELLIEPGLTGVIGPNGCGKTTLVSVILGQLAPRAGSVEHHADAALLDQHVSLLEASETLVENFQRLSPKATLNEACAALARSVARASAR